MQILSLHHLLHKIRQSGSLALAAIRQAPTRTCHPHSSHQRRARREAEARQTLTGCYKGATRHTWPVETRSLEADEAADLEGAGGSEKGA